MPRIKLRPGERRHSLEVRLSQKDKEKLGQYKTPEDSEEALRLLIESGVVSEKRLQREIDTAAQAELHKRTERQKRRTPRVSTEEELEALNPLIHAGRTLAHAMEAVGGTLPAVYQRVGVGLGVRVVSAQGEELFETAGIAGEYSREAFDHAFKDRERDWRSVGIGDFLINDWRQRCEKDLETYESALELYAGGHSQASVAQKLNVSQKTILGWERGKKVPWAYRWVVHEGKRERYDIPRQESADFAYILGSYAATTIKPSRAIRVLSQDKESVKHFQGCVERVFGAHPRVAPSTSSKITPIWECDFSSVQVLSHLRRITQGNTIIPFEHVVTPAERESYFQALLDFNSGVTHKVLYRRGERKTYPEITLTFTGREEFAKQAQVLTKMNGVYPLYIREGGRIHRLQITGKADLQAVQDVGFTSDRKNRKLDDELAATNYVQPDHGPEIYYEVVERYKAGQSQRSIGREFGIDKKTVKQWGEGDFMPARVVRYELIQALEKHMPNPEVVGYAFRELGADPYVARKLGREQGLERIRETCDFLRERGVDIRDQPGLLLYPRDALERKFPKLDVTPTPAVEERPLPTTPTIERRPVEAALGELGAYQEILDTTPVLPKDEQYRLAVAAKSGDVDARDWLINSNLRLIISIARKYMGRGLELQELVTEGYMGYMRGLGKYDPDMINPESGEPYAVNTYCMWWTRQGIQGACVEQGKTVRLPQHAIDDISKMREEYRRFIEDAGLKPTDEELAPHLGWKPKKVKAYREYLEKSGMRSLDQAFGEDDEETLLSHLTNRDEQDVPDQAEASMMRTVIGKALDTIGLNERERDIIEMHYGLGDYDGETQTLKQIGRKHGVTRERIRQIEARSLNKLQMKKQNPYVRTLLDYVSEEED